MSPRVLIVIAVTAILVVGAGVVGWMLVQPGTTAEIPATTSGSTAAQSAHRTRFFNGDPDRNVRAGQEMKPRW